MPATEDRVTEDKVLQQIKRMNPNVASGLATGTICAALFNPWDRALHLSVKNNRSFMLKTNFTNPFQGFAQAMFQRSVFGSVYYIMQGEMKVNLYPYLRNDLELPEYIAQLGVGLGAGSVDGILKNSTSAIKHYTWGDEKRTFTSSAKDMWKKGGIRPFINGTSATVYREMTFGSTYEMLRSVMSSHFVENSEQKNRKFLCDVAAGGIATVASSPFNFVRNMQYATPANQTPVTVIKTLKAVWNESKESPLNKINFFQRRFCLGWGTARVATSMGIGQFMFDEIKKKVFDR